MSIESLSIKTEGELEQILVNEISTVEKGLTVVGNQVPINAAVKLDILCHDEDGALVVFKLSTNEDDSMLFEGLKALIHLDDLKYMIKFHCARAQDYNVDEAKVPRLIMFAPSFSKTLLAIANHISGVRIDLYDWEYLKFGDLKGLRIKPAFLSPKTASEIQGRKMEIWRKKEEPTERFVPMTPKHSTPPTPVPITTPAPVHVPATTPTQEKKEEPAKELAKEKKGEQTKETKEKKEEEKKINTRT